MYGDRDSSPIGRAYTSKKNVEMSPMDKRKAKKGDHGQASHLVSAKKNKNSFKKQNT